MPGTVLCDPTFKKTGHTTPGVLCVAGLQKESAVLQSGLGKLGSCSVQFSSVSQSCPTLCDAMNRSTPGLPVHHHLLEFTQTQVYRVGDAATIGRGEKHMLLFNLQNIVRAPHWRNLKPGSGV